MGTDHRESDDETEPALARQTESSTGPDAPSSRVSVRESVGQTFATIMRERYPGSTWLPVEGAKRNAAPGSGKLVSVLSVPHDSDAILDLPAPAFDVDNVDAGCKQALALSEA